MLEWWVPSDGGDVGDRNDVSGKQSDKTQVDPVIPFLTDLRNSSTAP